MQTIPIKLTATAMAEVRKLADYYTAQGCGPDDTLDDPLGHFIELAIMEAGRAVKIQKAREEDQDSALHPGPRGRLKD